MTFVPTPHCARVVFNFTHSGESFSYVQHFTKTDFVTADMEALAAYLDGRMDANWMPNFPTGIFYQNITIYDIRTSTGEVVINNDGAGAGALAHDPLPINVAMVLTLRTATRGRTGRGRVYLAGFSETQITDGLFIAGALALGLGWGDEMELAEVATGWDWVIRSIQTDGVALNPAVTRPVTDFEVRNASVGTQRRRVDRA